MAASLEFAGELVSMTGGYSQALILLFMPRDWLVRANSIKMNTPAAPQVCPPDRRNLIDAASARNEGAMQFAERYQSVFT